MPCGSRISSLRCRFFYAFLFLAPGVCLLDKVLKACVHLRNHLDFCNVVADYAKENLLDLVYGRLDKAMNKLKALPRLYNVLTLGTLSEHFNSYNSAEIFYYFTIFFNELTETLVNGPCADLEKKMSLLRRNITRPALVFASLKSFTKEQVAFVRKCLHADKYYAETLLADDTQWFLPVSTCLNYQLLLRRIENLFKTVAWHMKSRNPKHCYLGLLQLLLGCCNTGDEKAISRTYIHSAKKCHNLVDICLGPINSSSSGVIFRNGRLLNMTNQLQAIYDPILPLRILNNTFNVITSERIQSVVEDCERLRDDADNSTDLIEQTNQDVRSYVLAAKGRPVDVSFAKLELEATVKSLRLHLDKARDYMERIEKVAKLVESQVCMSYKRRVWNTSGLKASTGGHLNGRNRNWDDNPSCQCKVEALRDISSAYQAAQYIKRKFFNVLLRGSGYEPDLPEGPLLVVELKTVPLIHQTTPPSSSLNHQTIFVQSNGAEQTEVSPQWLEWSTESTSNLRNLSSFVFVSLSLMFAM